MTTPVSDMAGPGAVLPSSAGTLAALRLRVAALERRGSSSGQGEAGHLPFGISVLDGGLPGGGLLLGALHEVAGAGPDVEHGASAALFAVTRWRVHVLPSGPALPHAPGVPGLDRALWRLELLRCRGGEACSWVVEACDAQGRLSVVADLADRQAARESRRDRA